VQAVRQIEFLSKVFRNYGNFGNLFWNGYCCNDLEKNEMETVLETGAANGNRPPAIQP
jgi:hypothetical protein